jgi:predicted amidohydrolase
MKAGFYQFSPVFGRVGENLDKVEDVLGRTQADLIVLPELFTTGYQFVSRQETASLAEAVPEGLTTRRLVGISRLKNLYIVAGIAEACGKKLYNSAVVTGPDGFIGVYRKTHLYNSEKLFFDPGDTGFKVWDTPRGRVGVMICFDWFFPESARSLALLGADVIAHPANLVMPFWPNAVHVRALENRLYIVTADRTGVEDRQRGGGALNFIGQSVIASPRGEVLCRASQDGDELVVTELDISLAKNKNLNELNDIFADRRPDLYSL